MTPPRRDARTAPAAVMLLCLAVAAAAGCSRAPRPRADVPAPTGTATRNGNGAATARRVPASAPKPAPAPAPEGGTRNGGSVAGAQAGSSTTQPSVVPQLSPAEVERLEKETRAAVEQAQKSLDAVDAAKLDVERNRKYLIARDFLDQAAAARAKKEYERAQSLAQKARLLAEEIAAR